MNYLWLLLNKVVSKSRRFLHSQAEGLEKSLRPTLLDGMTSLPEQEFYRDTALESRLTGEIVDLGCWLGSTSISLARGLEDNPNRSSAPHRKVNAFDIFKWEDWMGPYEGLLYCRYKSGDSFLPEVRRILLEQNANHLVNLIDADLETYLWPGDPVSILLVDAMKSPALCRQIARTFFPSLEVGASLIHQDFKHYYTPWIHVLQYELKDSLASLADVPNSGTHAFTVMKSIRPDEIESAISRLDETNEAYLLNVFGYSLGNVPHVIDRAKIMSAHMMAFIHAGDNGKALKIFDLYRDEIVGLVGKVPDLDRALAHISK